MKFRVGDEIVITAGKDKGRRGKIERILPSAGRVLIPGLNIYKKHQKALGRKKGGIIEFSRPLPIANVSLVCPACEKPTRIGIKILKNKEKTRICRKCGRQIEGKVKSDKQ